MGIPKEIKKNVPCFSLICATFLCFYIRFRGLLEGARINFLDALQVRLVPWEFAGEITYDTSGEDDNLQRVNICGAQIDGSSVFIS